MRSRRAATSEDLRLAIDCLPRHTRAAMLEAIRSEAIIAGAYATREGVCPMLAAHRRGGRTNLIAFARAWDSFVFRGARVARPRPATARELLVLRTHLEASLLGEEVPQGELGEAIAEHRELVRRRRRRERRRPGDPDRRAELAAQPGWSWMRVVRRYDEYQRAIAALQPGRRPREAGAEAALAR